MILNNGIVLLILIFLIGSLAFKAKYSAGGNNGFFDIDNTKAMRGFWCFIIILVHVPDAYQNRIQDMIGSFAYIGVTFFFMTSAYGLSLGTSKRSGTNGLGFWVKRLPKLLVPNWTANAVFALIFLSLSQEIPSAGTFLSINHWVQWLLICYVIFWLGHTFIPNEKLRHYAVMAMTLLFSIIIYGFVKAGSITTTTWFTEIFGFIWGVLLYLHYDEVKKRLQSKWLRNVAVCFAASLVLGVLYIKFKPVVFVGDYVLKILLGVALIGFILALNSRIALGNKVCLFFGEISFEMFLIHGRVFKLVGGLHAGLSSGPYILVSILLTILLAYVIHLLGKLVLRILNPLLNKIA